MSTISGGSLYHYDTKAGRRWAFVIDAPAAERRSRRQLRRKGFTTRQAARDGLDGTRVELRAGRVPVPDDGTVAGFAAGWLEALPAEGLERSTIRYHGEAIRRLLPVVGGIRLQELSALDLDRAYAALREGGRAPRTIRASHVSIKKMLDEAIRLGLVGENVAVRARPPRPKAARPKRFPTWDLEQLARFLAATADAPEAALWWVAGYTGMRRGELVALLWPDVDLDEGVISVFRAIGEAPGKVTFIKLPKSDAGRRRVELDPGTVAVLKEHRKEQLARRLALGSGWRDEGLVFCRLDGSAMHPNRATERWRCLVRKKAPELEMPVIRLHDLRHSHATQLLAAGTRPDVVTERLGHSSVAFTLATYGHVYEGDQRAAMARLLGPRGVSSGVAVTSV